MAVINKLKSNKTSPLTYVRMEVRKGGVISPAEPCSVANLKARARA